MRISDWSSDVCSSDLSDGTHLIGRAAGRAHKLSFRLVLAVALRLPTSFAQPHLEEFEDFVARRPRRLARLVDQVDGERVHIPSPVGMGGLCLPPPLPPPKSPLRPPPPPPHSPHHPTTSPRRLAPP